MKRKEIVITTILFLLLVGVAYSISLYQNRTEPINHELQVILEKIHKIEVNIENEEEPQVKKENAKLLIKEISHLKRVFNKTYIDDTKVFISEPKLEEELDKYLIDKNISIEMMKLIREN